MLNKVDAFGTSYSLHKVNEKTPIVFVHGVGLTKEIWEPQIGFFKDYNTLTYDLLGHGKTSLKKSKVSFEDFSKQLVRLINELNFNKIHLVGFSMGALIARHFASEHSDKLNSLKVILTLLAHSIPQRCLPFFISTNLLSLITLLKFLDISGVDPTSFSPVVIRVLTLIFLIILSSSV